ncbi:DEAD/DEAH box helicase [Corynebacterium sp. sy039]|uniref:DEAD/DEAH box helicase n=1 Tax=Corynebacterium sp. sy039 TaxID=2599641 RepID=UPI0011B7437A|nr:DEAD/DEAH box helicase [Corynebacterium sp. sy039]QDZ42358.1 DEAD/DEAH box helicase [Corynebacterium sp. sy039]
MTSHLIHGLWRRDSGMHLWIEQVEGHRIVAPADVPDGVLSPVLAAALSGRKFNHRVPMELMTPKGRMVKLHVPTIAYAPQQAVEILSQLEPQWASIASDLRWMIHLYRGTRQFVRAGRLSLRLSFHDTRWFPMWQLTTGLKENAWLVQMNTAAPGVLLRNSSTDLAHEMAQELSHWIANSFLTPFAQKTRATPLHNFTKALLESKPISLSTVSVVSALNAWRDSITASDAQLVVIAEEPPKDSEQFQHCDPQDMVWAIRLRVRSGTDTPIPIDLSAVDRLTRERLHALKQELFIAAPTLASDATLSEPAQHMRDELASLDGAGQWDCYLSMEQMGQFLAHDVAQLRKRGFSVLLPKAWSMGQTKAAISVKTADNVAQSQIGLDKIIEYDWKISIDDINLDEMQMRQLINSKSGLIELQGKWVVADTATVKKINQYMQQLAQSSKKKLLADLAEAKMHAELAAPGSAEQQHWAGVVAQLEQQLAQSNERAGAVTIADLREVSLRSEQPIAFSGDQWAVQLAGGVAAFDTPAPVRVPIPDIVQADLRDYQRRGVDWLHWMSANNLGAILADDMGLGKTLQLLALEAVERCAKARQERRPTLIIAPTSVVGNWQREVHKFVPEFRVVVQHGASRKRDEEFIDQASNVDLVISSYGTVTRDYAQFAQIEWERVVVDEAQQIKNSSTKVARAVRAIPARHRIALTGTPIENKLTELRSILDFCNPGILGSASFFINHFARAIERHHDEVMTQRLKALTAPFILRRLKTDTAIISDLPEKSEIVLSVKMTAEQTALYTSYVEQIKKLLQESEGIARRGVVLSALTRIKQICNHPAHFLGDNSSFMLRAQHRSGKTAELMRLVSMAQETQQRVLIFTQYRAFGDILASYLSDYFDQPIPFLHGGVSKIGRDRLLENFQRDDGPPVMVLSLKAGGTGLNLTAASMVIHMDRWWNPAVENQATDRAFRIGQRKNVTVYKMVTVGTLEESIQDIIEGKMQLAGAVVGEGEGWLTELSTQELEMLISYRDSAQAEENDG